ncbi:MAG: hypothetical protein SAJ11_24055, partial [Jaaginema sp. PMC 1078.18]|nr:hypothetical protein [Jaaginema sp. PMC 1078.18]
HYSYQDLQQSLQALPNYRLAIAIILVIIGYGFITLYELLGLYYIKRSLAYLQVAFAAFTSYSFSNTVGFPLLTSSTIRYRLYLAWGLDFLEITQLIAFSNLSFSLGISTVGGFLAFHESTAVSQLFHLPSRSVQLLGIFSLALISVYLLFVAVRRHSLQIKIRKKVIRLPTLRLSLAQIVTFALDWAAAAGILYSLILPTEPLSFSHFMTIYVLAKLGGTISNVPGGLGVFDSIIILLLADKVTADSVLSALLIFRIMYYFLPFLIALILLGWREFKQHLNFTS